MNVAHVSIGAYFLIGSGDGFVYEKIGDRGKPEQESKPYIYRYNWSGLFLGEVDPHPDIEVHPVEVLLNNPQDDMTSASLLVFGSFFLRDTEPDHYYQFFSDEKMETVLAFQFDQFTGDYLDASRVPKSELVRPLSKTLIVARKYF